MAGKKKDALGTTALDALFGDKSIDAPADRDVNQDVLTDKTTVERPRFTVRISNELQERVRDAVYWDRDTVTAFVEAALEAELQKREAARGEAYPARAGEIRPGRPVGK